MIFENKKEMFNFIFAIFLMIGIVIGCFQALERSVGRNGCRMQTVASYIFIGRYAMCELFKPRYNLQLEAGNENK